MKSKKFSLGSLDELKSPIDLNIKEISQNEIAIIGIGLKFPLADNIDEYWHNIKNGIDSVHNIPSNRRSDMDAYFSRNNPNLKGQYAKAAFLKNIDEFDAKFFNITPKEAKLMSPNHRLFLQVAYNAALNAGYGGSRLSDTQTGVFVGFSGHNNLIGANYAQMIHELAPSEASLAYVGNLFSVLAGRVSYFMNLKGPSVVVDTICSSSLVSVHMACEAIRSSKCKMAIAGGVKTVPFALDRNVEGEVRVGIESSNCKTRTFDDHTDGTGFGEGAAAIFLKPLSQAMKDNDYIYAVIKASDMNQNGDSVGITVPNSQSQVELISKIYKDAKIDVEHIGLIEAHGTGTPLGDPIEINALDQVFRKKTNKKQFCAIGSVKSNLGHLTEGAGIAGLIKAVLALKNKQIPPTINFQIPNRKISFESSPIYVNDKLKNWEKTEFPKLAGVSSFGMSGTNCHVLLEEAPPLKEDSKISKQNFLVLSAFSKEALLKTVKSHYTFLKFRAEAEISRFCYTTNISQGNYKHRLVVIFENKENLLHKLKNILIEDEISYNKSELIFYKSYKIVSSDKSNRLENEITLEDVNRFNRLVDTQIKEYLKEENKSNLYEIAELYIQGAQIDWKKIYTIQEVKFPLNAYEFDKKRYWIQKEETNKKQEHFQANLNYPLVKIFKGNFLDEFIYSAPISCENNWEVNDHVIFNKNMLVGTSYIEIILETAKELLEGKKLQISDFIFQEPFKLEKDEQKELFILLEKQKDFDYSFKIGSKNAQKDEEWVIHAKGHLKEHESSDNDILFDVEKYRNRSQESLEIQSDLNYENYSFSKRWKTLKEALKINSDEFLLKVEVENFFKNEIENYIMHPALLDVALNRIGLSSKDLIGFFGEATQNDIYLPFYFSTINIYKPIKTSFYSHIKKSKKENYLSLDITLIDEKGEKIAEFIDYQIKKINKSKLISQEERIYNKVEWIAQKSVQINSLATEKSDKILIVFKNSDSLTEQLVEKLNEKYNKIIKVELKDKYEKIQENFYQIASSQDDYDKLIENFKDSNFDILNLQNISIENTMSDFKLLQKHQKENLFTIYYLFKSLLKHNIRKEINIHVIADYVQEIDGSEKVIKAENAAIFGFCKALNNEVGNLNFQFIDIDQNSKINEISSVIGINKENRNIALRNGKQFKMMLKNIDLDTEEESNISIKANGTYLISGGSNGIGLQMALNLSQKENVNLILVNRSQIPQRNLWQQIINLKKDKKMIERIKVFNEIEKNGSKIEFYSADISKADQVEKVFEDVYNKYHTIHGIIHSAGLISDGMLLNKSKEEIESVMAVKVYGAWLMNNQIKENIDFFVNFSSLASLFASPGQAAYVAANSFLDSFCYYQRKKNINATTVNWPAWNETGMVSNNDNLDYIINSSSNKQGIEAFNNILSKKTQRVLVGSINTKSRDLELLNEVDFALDNNLQSVLNARLKNRPKKQVSVILLGRKDNKYTETEKAVGQIWSNILGFEEIGVFDDFFEMGGDSILLAKIHSEIEKEFPGKISVGEIFEYPTIKSLAEIVSDTKIEKQEDIKENISAIFDSLQEDNFDLDKVVEDLENL